MNRIIIAGGRDFTNYTLLVESCNIFLKDYSLSDIEIVSGRAVGADLLGEKYAQEYKLSIKIFEAQWSNLEIQPCQIAYNSQGRYNRLAGFNRNREMAKYATHLIAFWDGKSKGTKNMINLAKEYNLITRIIKYENCS